MTKRVLIICVLFISSIMSVPLSATTARYMNWCESGGKPVALQGLNSSTSIQATLASCSVSVFLHSTITFATIYSDSINTPLSNPFTANSDGSFGFYADISQHYDVQISGTVTCVPNVGGCPGNGQQSVTFTYTDVILGGGGVTGLSGMTTGQVPIAANSSTVTSSKAIQGTDGNILSSGTISGLLNPLCTDSNGGATTVNCPVVSAQGCTWDATKSCAPDTPTTGAPVWTDTGSILTSFFVPPVYNRVGIEPNSGARMVFATTGSQPCDGTHANSSWVTPSNSAMMAWSPQSTTDIANHIYYLIVSSAPDAALSAPCLIQFNRNTMQVVSTTDMSSLHLTPFGTFDQAHPHIWTAPGNGTGGTTPWKIYTVDITNLGGGTSLSVDLSSAGNCPNIPALTSTTNGEVTMAYAGGRFAYWGNGSQDNANTTWIYDTVKGCMWFNWTTGDINASAGWGMNTTTCAACIPAAYLGAHVHRSYIDADGLTVWTENNTPGQDANGPLVFTIPAAGNWPSGSTMFTQALIGSPQYNSNHKCFYPSGFVVNGAGLTATGFGQLADRIRPNSAPNTAGGCSVPVTGYCDLASTFNIGTIPAGNASHDSCGAANSAVTNVFAEGAYMAGSGVGHVIYPWQQEIDLISPNPGSQHRYRLLQHHMKAQLGSCTAGLCGTGPNGVVCSAGTCTVNTMGPHGLAPGNTNINAYNCNPGTLNNSTITIATTPTTTQFTVTTGWQTGATVSGDCMFDNPAVGASDFYGQTLLQQSADGALIAIPDNSERTTPGDPYRAGNCASSQCSQLNILIVEAGFSAFSGNYTYSGNNTYSGTNTHSGSETFANINNVHYVDGVKYPCTSAGVTAAQTDLSSGGTIDASNCTGTLVPGGQLVLSQDNISFIGGRQTWNFTDGSQYAVLISGNNVVFQCRHFGTILTSNALGTPGAPAYIFRLTGAHDEVRDCELQGQGVNNDGKEPGGINIVSTGKVLNNYLTGTDASHGFKNGIVSAAANGPVYIEGNVIDSIQDPDLTQAGGGVLVTGGNDGFIRNNTITFATNTSPGIHQIYLSQQMARWDVSGNDLSGGTDTIIKLYATDAQGSGCQYINVHDNLVHDGGNQSGNPAAITIDNNCTFNTIHHNLIFNYANNPGIELTGDAATKTPDHNVIDGNFIYNVGTNCILDQGGSEERITGNYCLNNSTLSAGTYDAIQISSLTPNHADNNLIQGNRVEHTGGSTAFHTALKIYPDAPTPTNNQVIGNALDVGNFGQALIDSGTGTNLLGNFLATGTNAPSISSGFGTSPSVSSSKGPYSFIVNVGTGGSATSGVVAMPAIAPAGWVCAVTDQDHNIATRESAYTTTTVTVTAASAWNASDHLLFVCNAL